MNFSRTPYARLLPAARSILFFASGAPRLLHDYGSRVGLLTSWKTTHETLGDLGDAERVERERLGRQPDVLLFVRLDNVQQYFKQWQQRIGKENQMVVGLAAYAAEAVHFTDPTVVDLDNHLDRRRMNRRKELTMAQLEGWLNFDHAEQVGTLQWLNSLVNHIPQLAQYKGAVAKLYHDTSVTLPPPHDHQTRIHSLATSSKNETSISEFRDGVADFVGQLGQTEDSYARRLIPIGGDGLTFELLVKMRNYLQFHEDDFQSFRILFPFLETFHTVWTFLSTCFEEHWGDALTHNPSDLAYSATKINQKGPSNLKKVDFYPSLFLALLILDMRMLDCWRVLYGASDIFAHFNQLEKVDKIPTLMKLREDAAILYRRYSQQRSYTQVAKGDRLDDCVNIPSGTRWDPLVVATKPRQAEETLAEEAHTVATPGIDNGDSETTSDKQQAVVEDHSDSQSDVDVQSSSDSTLSDLDDSGLETPKPFTGDEVLARSIAQMCDLMLVREMTMATAMGDAGRVYEAMKVRINTHAAHLSALMCES